ncbi:MAG: multicopper oxidase domain-containing protein [Chloroflexi bacterium]|nr:multicopper oxidase domain-containing protein [Chloroflexota bacterium]MCI0783026.1 multicopper oxidase domain-containing protein [Chloroflexota bacterium]MCI0838950.1 multicopper oxidase domain-containing protein [Chloroflexota bacterium]MCI0883445.1 multicopper oxidase domain-containing protein [Chloroflexota bacterium]
MTGQPISRRRMLKLTATTGLAVAATALVGCSDDGVTVPAGEGESVGDASSTGGAASVVEATAADPRALPIPPRLEGPVIDLTMQAGEREFLPGVRTPTKGYNGDYLGPTLVLRAGSDVNLNVTNDIGVSTTTHWHGMHVPAVMDGGPHQSIEPGETWHASFPVLNRAATYWYHPHPHAGQRQGALFDPMSTGYQVYEGLAGMIIVEDDLSDALPLPRSYGVDDIPLILQDKRFHDDGSLMHFPDDFDAATDPALRKGDHFLANGVDDAVLNVGAQVIRLRVLNASNARIYNLGFSDDRTFYQVASDGGFLASPVPLSRLVMATGERAEILVDLGADEGRTLALRSFNGGNDRTFVPPQLQDAWDTTDFDLLEIRIGSPTADAVLTIPERLTDLPRVPESDAVNSESPRPFVLGVNPFEINGVGMDMAVINERIRLGDTEVWEVSNPNQQAHPFHVHGDSFQIVSRDGAPPPANELGWKDVVLLRPRETVRLIKSFRDYADPGTPYMYHCHILEHEDVGMMGQFVVEEV